jgi:hypothetical protein
MSVYLGPAPDETNRSQDFQYDTLNLYRSLETGGIKYRITGLNAVGIVCNFILPLSQAVIPTLGVVVVAWLKARSGRKVHLEFDGLEAEAQTPEEIGDLLKRAAEFQDRKKDRR